jgi:hypothetical protein
MLAMKFQIATAALVLLSAPAFAQTTGVSKPDPVTITTTDDTAPQPALTPRTQAPKPSAATPAMAAPPADASTAAPAGTVYGAYVPYKGPAVANSADSADEDGGNTAAAGDDLDAMIVTSVPEREGELREGTLLKTKIKEDLSTATTMQGSRFTAELTEPIERKGRVILPVGSILEGRVTEVHGGRRISGAAALHLETRDILLPDGTHYVVHAQLIDTGKSEFRVTDEGTLKRKDRTKENLAVVSLATGTGAAAGAVVGGGVGALVGAGIGAGMSTVVWLKEDRQATLPKDVELVFSLTAPMILTPLSDAPVSGMNAHGSAGMGGGQ